MSQARITAIEQSGLAALEQCRSDADVTQWEVKYLGRKSELSNLLRELKHLSPAERKIVGPLGNAAKARLQEAGEKKRESLGTSSETWERERIDVTVPGERPLLGHLHPITLVIEMIEDIFSSMGFETVEGPEVESEWYNFDALNFPPDHPARDMQDAFYIEGTFGKRRYLPRTHTSSAQVRYMETHTPPFRIIVPGRIFRNEATDASHEHTFHQFECLMVGDTVSVANFKSIAESFFSAFFQKNVAVRLRPSFFPFTEPSFEFDLSCLLCGGGGCSVCKGTGWIEIGGAGMIHQNVFQAAGYPRGKYQGFAWGFGLTRLCMMKYHISDIRLLMSGDLRFIRQF